MTRNVAQLLRGGAVFTAYFLVLLLILAMIPCSEGGRSEAFADEEDIDMLNMTALELQQEIEERQAAYAAARNEVDAAAAQIDEARMRIEELERLIPEQRERSAKAAREQYKVQQQSAGIVDLLLSSESFYEFLSRMEYMERISDANTTEMARLAQLKGEVEAEEDAIKATQREAEAKAEDARGAMESAQEAQAEVQRRIEEEARAQAEIAAQAAALAEEPRDNDSGAPVDEGAAEGDSGSGASGTNDPGSGNSGAGDSGSGDSDAGAGDSGATSAGDDSVDGWAARIDAYLAGSPLAGQGRTFAEAALRYGVDPRWSPAISFTESSKGLYCFRSHNAWGWGSSSWGSWEEAIDAHVGGLSRGYGYTISVDAAKKYCPPNWQAWYDRTLAQMNMI